MAPVSGKATCLEIWKTAAADDFPGLMLLNPAQRGALAALPLGIHIASTQCPCCSAKHAQTSYLADTVTFQSADPIHLLTCCIRCSMCVGRNSPEP